jgi:predicted acyl esterase
MTTPSAGTRGPHRVREIENVWIPMSDGTRIAARMWIPEDAEEHPVPAIVEYHPYRKRDGTRSYDDLVHPILASHGYACVRPDIRGTGDSDGAPQDEYVKQEQDDGVEIVAWLADQPWCSGAVGMFGISWGGFSCLQVAARRPPALKAIITHCSTDDRYVDDAHFTGGCINDWMFRWGFAWMNSGVAPPDPAIVGEGWREQWLTRLESRDLYVADWMSHQHRDDFWKHGSISEDYGAIECAVYAVGGWADPYRHTVARMLANLECPRKGLVGPWGHQYPQFGSPGPAIDWQIEAVRWWDHWLKGIDTGIMAEPAYRVWMQDGPYLQGVRTVPGRWVAEERWPSSRIDERSLAFTETGLGAEGAAAIRKLEPHQSVGTRSPSWWPEPVNDVGADDERSLAFDSEPLAEPLQLLGAPSVDLDLAIDRPNGFVVVGLAQVAPDGTSNRLTFGVLNLTHRNGHETPEPVEPGRRYRIRLDLQDLAQVVPAGHRLRVVLATSAWPLLWPSPEPVVLTVFTEGCRLRLPGRPERADDAELVSFGELPSPPVAADPNVAVQSFDPATGTTTRRRSLSGSGVNEALGGRGTFESSELWEISDSDPTSARVELRSASTMRREDWGEFGFETLLRVGATRDDFLVDARITASENGVEVFSREWNRAIPRRLV